MRNINFFIDNKIVPRMRNINFYGDSYGSVDHDDERDAECDTLHF
jgi:hypothetical protein